MSTFRFLALFALIPYLSLSAITIDEFDGSTQVVANPGGNIANASSADAGIIGGKRKVTVFALPSGSPLSRISTIFDLGLLHYSQDTGTAGFSIVRWDGGAVTADPNGLAAIDFTQDGSDAIRLEVLSFDHANNQALTITVNVYGDGGRLSSSDLVLSTPILSNTAFDLPYSSFVAQAGYNPVDFTKVGAVEIIINRNMAYDSDLRLEWIGTNACRLVPNSSGKVVDECSVCGGDNSSCSDCLGVPNGTSIPGTNCSNGQLGICEGGTFNNACQCIRTNDPSTDICDGLDNDCDGTIDEDFPDLGGACSIGTGLCSVNGVYQCASGGMECSASSQQAWVDACEPTKGCDGVPNSGLVIDVCGVCGGNGTTCQDCRGVPNGPAKLDKCGVCEGDGISCLECNSFDQKATLAGLDSGAKQQLRLIKRLAKILVQTNAKFKGYSMQIREDAAKIENLNWHLAWSLPQVSTICQNRQFCATVSNEPTVTGYRKNSNQLLTISVQILRRLNKSGKKDLVKRYNRAAKNLHLENMRLADLVPLSQSACS